MPDRKSLPPTPSHKLGRLLSGKPGRILCALVLLAFIAAFNGSIAGKENLLANGQRLVLALAPVDPLSLMQGYYMDLRFQLEGDIRHALLNSPGSRYEGYSPAQRERRALAVVREQDGLARFVRLHSPATPLAPQEQLLAFKIIYDRYRESIQISGGSFFFEEGLERLYDRARFAELRVAPDGTALIANLLDKDRRIINKSLLKE